MCYDMHFNSQAVRMTHAHYVMLIKEYSIWPVTKQKRLIHQGSTTSAAVHHLGAHRHTQASKQADLDLFSLQQHLEVGMLVFVPLSLHLLQCFLRCLVLFSIQPLQMPPACSHVT